MNNWEVKEPLPEDDRRTTMYTEDPYAAPDMPYSPTAARYSAKY